MESLDNKKDRNKQRTLNICRCCLSDSCYKDISTEYYWLGQSEVYEKILKETFDVYISYQDGAGPSKGSRLICEECIVKLRDASTFKKLVLESEHNFLKHLENLRNKSLDIGDGEFEAKDIKHEINIEGLSVDNTDDFPDADNDATFDENLLGEIKEEAAKGDDSDEDDYVLEMLRTKRKGKRKTLSTSKAKSRVKKPKLALGEEIKKVDGSTSRRSKDIQINVSPRSSKDWTKIVERRGNGPILRENSLKLLENSTIIVFQWNKSRYRCFVCQEPFADMATLRQHTNNAHTIKNIEKIIILQQNKLVKVEISSLFCKLCSQQLDSLNSLKSHLTDSHEIEFGLTNDDLLVPFKLGGDDLKCQLCFESFRLFRLLNIHMNKHYQKQVCHICGAGFSNLVFLNLHKTRMHRPHFCKECGLEFSSRLEKRDHDVAVHNLKIERKLRFPCPYCDDRFLHENFRVAHLVEKHGMTRPEYKCSLCDKIYITKSLCTTHMRNVHMKEKNHECNMCNMRFYTKSDAKRHRVTHTGEKNFSCTFCSNLFATKDSLRRHLKRTHINL